MKGQFLLPFPHTVTDRIANGYSVTFVDVAHMSVVVLHNGWLQGFSSVITKVNFCWWIMEFVSICTSRLSLHTTAVMSPLFMTLTFMLFSLCPAFEVVCLSFTVWSNGTTAVHFLFC